MTICERPIETHNPNLSASDFPKNRKKGSWKRRTGRTGAYRIS
uniref:Uncharacterized protein n=1 Tax=Siphoviridae sp. ctVif31 TaxID=2825532 RepID=A0A8S5Q3D6_9CAUD|nr:MAG TPA: hypothetical protein [Siphoviridae sp. ctVif31]